VQTALSIQSHPDKALAGRLHASNPKEYRDANHKPEMALALEDFEALCGFVCAPELAAALDASPELAALVGGDAAAAVRAAAAAEAEAGEGGRDGSGGAPPYREALKAAFSAVMSADAASAAEAVDALAARLGGGRRGGQRGGDGGADGGGGGGPKPPTSASAPPSSPSSAYVFNSVADKDALALRLARQYPRDVGVLACYFLNLVRLPRGRAVHLPANVPHAYVSGQLVECMAESDNVVRAGLTPKFRDVATLCASLTYEAGAPEVLAGERAHDHAEVYRPPFDEFEVGRVCVPAGESGVSVPANPGPLLLLVTGGRGGVRAEGGVLPAAADARLEGEAELRRGSVLFVPAGARLTFSAGAGGGEPLEVWTAAVNARVFAKAAEEAAAGAGVAAAGAASGKEAVAAA
jgi:mannose-6-phosphate isomerase